MVTGKRRPHVRSPVATGMDTSEAAALALDAADPLRHFRERFHLLPGRIYLDGNSLGLLSRDAEAETLARSRGIVDYVASLTDSQAFALSEAISGRADRLWALGQRL